MSITRAAARMSLAAVATLGWCADRPTPTAATVTTAFNFSLPKGFPAPSIPAGNPMSALKVELGRYLFYEKRLSVNGTTSCATCHLQKLAFTDGRGQAVGATGQAHPRGAMSLVNVAYDAVFNWSDPTVHSLEQQALKPMFSSAPVELGATRAGLIKLVRTSEPYRGLFPRAFPGEANPYLIGNIAKAVASFERSIISGNSPYDRFHYGDAAAVSESGKAVALRGFLGYGGPSDYRWRGGFNFSDAGANTGRPNPRVE